MTLGASENVEFWRNEIYSTRAADIIRKISREYLQLPNASSTRSLQGTMGAVA